ncbi:hypothetical protein lpari_02271 [Legionella parisiensis]|uniref:Uncharacterized protein n=1 Tax=Legionella parisiensis TaxID=45071 RepID=A0A1E5JQZ9_9GAMM|nr:hypothetical protein lpari_02271 [Legionella parisiensis]STX77698.1 Uncharacterised protein [Legionella parisiensis]
MKKNSNGLKIKQIKWRHDTKELNMRSSLINEQGVLASKKTIS